MTGRGERHPALAFGVSGTPFPGSCVAPLSVASLAAADGTVTEGCDLPDRVPLGIRGSSLGRVGIAGQAGTPGGGTLGEVGTPGGGRHPVEQDVQGSRGREGPRGSRSPAASGVCKDVGGPLLCRGIRHPPLPRRHFHDGGCLRPPPHSPHHPLAKTGCEHKPKSSRVPKSPDPLTSGRRCDSSLFW